MWSRIPREARPVRIAAMSCWRSERAFSMRVFRLASTSLMEANCGPLGAVFCSAFISFSPIAQRARFGLNSRLYGTPGLLLVILRVMVRFLAVLLGIVAWQAFYCLA